MKDHYVKVCKFNSQMVRILILEYFALVLWFKVGILNKIDIYKGKKKITDPVSSTFL
jgi:hypothetical protein